MCLMHYQSTKHAAMGDITNAFYDSIKVQDDLVKSFGLKNWAQNQQNKQAQFHQVFQIIGVRKLWAESKTILAAKYPVGKAIQLLFSLPSLTATGYLDRCIDCSYTWLNSTTYNLPFLQSPATRGEK